jgi:hypothetical protein
MTELILEWIIRKIVQGLLILGLGLNLACASSPREESFPVGSAPWEVEAREAKLLQLEQRIELLEGSVNQIREATADGFEAAADLAERQEKINAILAGESK